MDYSTILHRYAPLPENLLMILHDIQNADPRSYVSPEAIESIATYLNTTMARVYGVVGYYSMLSTEPRGRHIIRLCSSPVCRMMGGFDLLDTLHTQLGISLNETTEDGEFSLELSECLGNCHHAPSLMIDEVLYSSVTRESLTKIIERIRREATDV